MPRNLAPALLASEADLVEYHVADAEPVDPSAPNGYVERYIHSEIYKRYPGVNSVIHSHASEVIPYTISGMWTFILSPHVYALICDLFLRSAVKALLSYGWISRYVLSGS